MSDIDEEGYDHELRETKNGQQFSVGQFEELTFAFYDDKGATNDVVDTIVEMKIDIIYREIYALGLIIKDAKDSEILRKARNLEEYLKSVIDWTEEQENLRLQLRR